MQLTYDLYRQFGINHIAMISLIFFLIIQITLPNMLTIATKGARKPFVFRVRSKLILIRKTMLVCNRTRNGKPVKLRTQKKQRPRLKLKRNYLVPIVCQLHVKGQKNHKTLYELPQYSCKYLEKQRYEDEKSIVDSQSSSF